MCRSITRARGRIGLNLDQRSPRGQQTGCPSGGKRPVGGRFQPRTRAQMRRSVRPFDADMGELEPADTLTVEWRVEPWHRTKWVVASLSGIARRLADPDSKTSVQPVIVAPRLTVR